MTTKTWTQIIKYSAKLALALVALMLAGCSSPSTTSGEIPVAATTGASTNTAAGGDISPLTPGPEILQPGDSMSIIYNDLPTVTPPWEGEIRPDGTITLILNQNFKAAGLTQSQLEQAIRDRYVPKIFKQLTVTIKPKQDSRFYYVGGEVRSPGRQIYLSRLTMLKAIQSVGDFTDFAKKKKVQLTRMGSSKPIIVNCVEAMQDSNLDLEIHPGDKIYVPRRLF